MSQPNLPNITPNITLTRDDAVNLVLSSIAMEEMGMSHILNAEGEKLQYVLGTLPGLSGPPATISDILAVNSSVKDMVNAITKNEYVLQQKLEAVTSIPLSVGPPGPTGPAGGIEPDTILFNVQGPNNSVDMVYGEDLTFTSNTLDIDVTQGSAIVNIDIPSTFVGTTGPAGPAGPMGPTGATGLGLDGVVTYDPADSSGYQVGQVVYYNGNLYQVTHAPPSGTPDTSPYYEEVLLGITGATGATGLGLDGVVTYDPADSGDYGVGQVVYYEGNLYVVTQAPPSGIPDVSPDYDEVLAGITGPTGATGLGFDGVINYDPSDAGGYQVGQVVYYNGNLYKVTYAPPSGTPDTSPDYDEVLLGITGATGATGMGLDGVINYDPADSGGYQVGQLVYFNGNLYVVTQAPPSGNPDVSPDYDEVLAGITGATGATGVGLDGVITYDPGSSSGYQVGQIVYYDGDLYVVRVVPPSGTPDSSPDYDIVLAGITGPTGATGPAIDVKPFDPADSSGYLEGQVVFYQGSLYMVLQDNPVGTPDSSSDYELIAAISGPTGPTGPIGPPVDVVPYDPSDSSNYQVGQVVYYDGSMYVVTTAPPSGNPDTSSDYGIIHAVIGPTGPTGENGVEGAAGPQGARGPTGVAGPQGIQGPAGAQGPKGDKGDQGERGPQGITGPAGPQGPAGQKGATGDKGNQGEIGPQGPTGPTGEYINAEYSANFPERNLSISSDVNQVTAFTTTMSNNFLENGGVITSQVTGRYFLALQYSFAGTPGTRVLAQIRVNNVAVLVGNTDIATGSNLVTNPGVTTLTLTRIIDLTAGDNITIWDRCTTKEATVRGVSNLSIFKIR